MAEFGKFWNGYLLLNAVDMSARVTKALLTIGKEVFDLSHMGCLGRLRQNIGLEDHQLDLELTEDLSSAAGAGDVPVHRTLRLAWAAGVPFDVTFALNGSAASAANPTFTCGMTFSGGKLPIGGQHGQLLKTTLTLISSDADAIVISEGA